MMDQSKRETWLIAVWPGMGNVAVGAGAYLVTKLGAKVVHEIAPGEHFELQHIVVEEGLAKPGPLPKNLIFEWKDPTAKHDLLVFLGEEQPNVGGYAFCRTLVEFAMSRGVSRIVTFAAMASQLHPSETPRVFSAATNGELLKELKKLQTTTLKEGQIGGLNGVLLAAGAESNLPGMCLLGELPYFAAGIANPKASLAVLEVFMSMTGINIDLADLKSHADEVDTGLVELLEKLQQASGDQEELADEGFTVPEFAQHDDEDDEPEEMPKESKRRKPALNPTARRKIEQLFVQANKDRSKAFQLKQELDRLGVFAEYEDRFLDLFKKAE